MIEESWHKDFGDRKNELVLIGQEMDEALIRKELEECLLTEKELSHYLAGGKFDDHWPVPVAKPLAEAEM